MRQPTATTPAKSPALNLMILDNLEDPAWYATWWLLFYAFAQICFLWMKAAVPDLALMGYFTSSVPPLFAVLFPSIYLSSPLGMVWFLAWQFSLRSNYSAMGVQGMWHSKWAGLLWWFVPAANLFMPYLVLQELWKAGTPPAQGTEAPKACQQQRPSVMILSYWVLFFITSLTIFALGTGVFAPLPSDDAPRSVAKSVSHLDTLIVFSCIAQSLLQICIMDRLTKRQQALRARTT
jgi:hypothetical protein